MKKESVDYLVIGGGIAGYQAVLSLLPHGSVLLVSRGPLSSGSSYYAQGGLALPWGFGLEDCERHVQDTLRAGAGLCDEPSVRTLVGDGERVWKGLLSLDVPFDQDSEGTFLTTREAAHSVPRIVHAGGDRTGFLILSSLAKKVSEDPSFRFLSNHQLYRLRKNPEGKVTGALFLGETGHDLLEIEAGATILSTGGGSSLFLRSTNPRLQRGDGVAVASRAGCEIERMAYYQFHPTVLDIPGQAPFLLTEAMRGEGARVVNRTGRRFLFDYHPDGELAPRDVVSRALWLESRKSPEEGIFLSLTHFPKGRVSQRFPQVYRHCLELGLDLETTPAPIRPAAHFQMGGIRTDMNGRTTLPGLYAIGEVASTRVHGANRLASNSLLEALVMGSRVADAIGSVRLHPESGGDSGDELDQPLLPSVDIEEGWSRLRQILWDNAGIVRTLPLVRKGLHEILEMIATSRQAPVEGARFALGNGLLVARLILEDILTAPVAGANYVVTDMPASAGKNKD
ncbi:MAG: L-aspartate oxidase [Leptospirillum sp.]|jgi:L-aspartate oxidase